MRFTRLKQLSIVSVRNIDNFGGYWLHDVDSILDDALAMINASAGTLRHLCIFDRVLAAISGHILSNLTVLELMCPRSPDGFSEACAHLTTLESFTIVELTDHFIWNILNTHVNKWRNLHSLKLMSLDPVDSDQCSATIANIIANQLRLRRIDTNFPGMDANGVLKLVTAANKIPNLQVLGVDCRALASQEHLALLAESLPEQLTCLHLENCWENLPLEAEEMFPLVCWYII
jgi:hypothetical protein